MSVARRRSSAAPVETSPKMISSATRGGRRAGEQVDTVARRDGGRVATEAELADLRIGAGHDHFAVEGEGPEQRGIEDLRPKAGAHDVVAPAGAEAVVLGPEVI